MLSTLKNEKSTWSMNPGAHFETSVVGRLVILVAFVRRQIGQGYSKSGIFSGRPSMSPFLTIHFSMVIETRLRRLWISWEIFCFESAQTVGTTIFLFLWGLNFIYFYLKIGKIVFSLVGWSPRTTLKVNKFTMFNRFRCNLLKAKLKIWGHLTWTTIKCSHWIYNETVRKMA